MDGDKLTATEVDGLMPGDQLEMVTTIIQAKPNLLRVLPAIEPGRKLSHRQAIDRGRKLMLYYPLSGCNSTLFTHSFKVSSLVSNAQSFADNLSLFTDNLHKKIPILK